MTQWALGGLHPEFHLCFPPFSAFHKDFDTHLSQPSPVISLTFSAPLIFSCTLLIPGGSCQQPNLLCGRTPSLPQPSPSFVLCAHYICSSLYLPLNSQASIYSWTPDWTPQHIIPTPSHQHTQPFFFLWLCHAPAILFVSDTQAAKRSWGKSQNHADICQEKFTVSNLSTTKQSLYMFLVASDFPFPLRQFNNISPSWGTSPPSVPLSF